MAFRTPILCLFLPQPQSLCPPPTEFAPSPQRIRLLAWGLLGAAGGCQDTVCPRGDGLQGPTAALRSYYLCVCLGSLMRAPRSGSAGSRCTRCDLELGGPSGAGALPASLHRHLFLNLGFCALKRGRFEESTMLKPAKPRRAQAGLQSWDRSCTPLAGPWGSCLDFVGLGGDTARRD